MANNKRGDGQPIRLGHEGKAIRVSADTQKPSGSGQAGSGGKIIPPQGGSATAPPQGQQKPKT